MMITIDNFTTIMREALANVEALASQKSHSAIERVHVVKVLQEQLNKLLIEVRVSVEEFYTDVDTKLAELPLLGHTA